MKKITCLVLVSVAVTGCQNLQMRPNYDSPAGHNPYFQPASSAPSSSYNQQPMQQPQVAQAPRYVSGVNDEVVGKMNNLTERVRRVERAMIRLDRRMQLIERNELSRMTNGVMQGDTQQAPNQGSFQPMSYQGSEASSPARLPAVKQPYARPVTNSAGATYQPVAYQDNRITSSLGVARKAVNQQASPSPRGMGGAFGNMPSLADENDKKKNGADSSVSIWTIEYENGKIWPAREQLVSSREIVRALAGENPVAIYARGARPSSKEFRERVRAVSKYLSKVTKVDNVPIASMPAKHMDGDTIEIIVTQ